MVDAAEARVVDAVEGRVHGEGGGEEEEEGVGNIYYTSIKKLK